MDNSLIKKRKRKPRLSAAMYNRDSYKFATSEPKDFPSLKLLFHGEDVTEGDMSWTDRVSGVKCDFLLPLIKTEPEGWANPYTGPHKGVGVTGTVDNTITNITGTLPTLAKHALVLSMGHSIDIAGSSELFGSIGEAGIEFPALTSNGLAFNAAGALRVLGPALDGAPPGNVDSVTMSSFDLIDTTNPLIQHGQGSINNDEIPYGTGTSQGGTAINLGGPFTTVFFVPVTNEVAPWWFINMLAVFDFDNPVSEIEFKKALVEMPHSGQLYQGWKNRV